MLGMALNYQEELIKKYRTTWHDDRYKWYHAANFHEDITIHESDWVDHQSVSVHNGEVIGYIGYKIDRSSEYVYGLNILNLTEPGNVVFAMDLGIALRNIFEKYHFRRLEWSVIVGNPIESSYDKMCGKYGGRIVGTFKSRQRLFDNKFYDEKMYEIEIDDYFSWKNVRNKKGDNLS